MELLKAFGAQRIGSDSQTLDRKLFALFEFAFGLIVTGHLFFWFGIGKYVTYFGLTGSHT